MRHRPWAAGAAATADRGVPGDSTTSTMLAERASRRRARHDAARPARPALDRLSGSGVHVLQEKPLAHTLAEGQRLVEAASPLPAKIGICFQNRYNVVLTASRGAFSTPASWARSRVPTRRWSGRAPPTTTPRGRGAGAWANSGGGLLINQAIHTLDLVQWLLGDVIDIDGTGRHPQVPGRDRGGGHCRGAASRHATASRQSFYATLTAPHGTGPSRSSSTARTGPLTIRDGLTRRRGGTARVDQLRQSARCRPAGAPTGACPTRC